MWSARKICASSTRTPIDCILFCRRQARWRFLLQRITFKKDVLNGKPTLRGLRISVEMVLELLTKGASRQEILEDYPDLEPEDIQAALLYAHHLVTGETVFDRIAA